MDSKTYLGSLAEAKVLAKLTEQKYHVFIQASGKAPFDLVAYKDDVLYRVSVKGTNSVENGAYKVTLSSTRSNRTGNRVIPFDSNTCDILAVYIQSLDCVCFIKADKILSTRSLAIREKPSKYSNKNKSWIVGDLEFI